MTQDELMDKMDMIIIMRIIIIIKAKSISLYSHLHVLTTYSNTILLPALIVAAEFAEHPSLPLLSLHSINYSQALVNSLVHLN